MEKMTDWQRVTTTGKYRVWYSRNGVMYHFGVDSPAEGARAIVTGHDPRNDSIVDMQMLLTSGWDLKSYLNRPLYVVHKPVTVVDVLEES